jgi:hypothetical protein
MTDETRNAILVLCGIGTLAIQFLALRKPIETKIAILLWLAELSGTTAIFAAAYFLMTSDKITLPSACAFYNFLVQGALFALSPSPAARKDILSIVFAAVFFATVPMYAATGALLKTQTQMVNVESEMVKLHGKTASILDKVYQVLAMPSPSPSPPPHTP